MDTVLTLRIALKARMVVNDSGPALNGCAASTADGQEGAVSDRKESAASRSNRLPRVLVSQGLPPRRRSTVRFGRVSFGCPACRRDMRLSARHCGNFVSCPHCFTGIRVPDPKNGIPAQNMGRTVAPLLHPQRFEAPTGSRQFMPWFLTGRLTGAQALTAAGVMLLFAGVAAVAPVVVGWAKGLNAPNSLADNPSHLAPAAPAPVLGKAAAADVVKAFLAAPTPEAKARLVLEPAKALGMLKSWYASQSAAQTTAEAAADVGEARQGFYARGGESKMVSKVPVTSKDGRVVTYLVEHNADGPKIAWAESVGFSPVPWQKVLTSSPKTAPVKLRVLACRDDYYNFGFKDESRFSCIRLHDPRTLEMLGYAYAERRVGVEQSLEVHLPPARTGQLRPVMVAVKPVSASAKTRQVELVGPVTPGWQDMTVTEDMAVAHR